MQGRKRLPEYVWDRVEGESHPPQMLNGQGALCRAESALPGLYSTEKPGFCHSLNATVLQFVACAVVHIDIQSNTTKPPTSSSLGGGNRGGVLLKQRQSAQDGVRVEMGF